MNFQRTGWWSEVNQDTKSSCSWSPEDNRRDSLSCLSPKRRTKSRERVGNCQRENSKGHCDKSLFERLYHTSARPRTNKVVPSPYLEGKITEPAIYSNGRKHQELVLFSGTSQVKKIEVNRRFHTTSDVLARKWIGFRFPAGQWKWNVSRQYNRS